MLGELDRPKDPIDPRPNFLKTKLNSQQVALVSPFQLCDFLLDPRQLLQRRNPLPPELHFCFFRIKKMYEI